MIISIDGPAGSGKSTVAANLAKRLAFLHLNSGALYRAVAVLAVDRGIALSDGDALAKLAGDFSFRFILTNEGTQLVIENSSGEQVLGNRLASEQAGEWASQVAVHPQLREILTNVQRQIGRENSLVVEGRDAGTVVFPNAEKKFYLDADVQTRARRRLHQSGEAKAEKLQHVAANIRDRDKRDAERTEAPLQLAKDAVKIDTSALSAEEVVEKLLKLINP